MDVRVWVFAHRGVTCSLRDAATDLGALPVVSSRTVPDGQMLLAGGVVFVGEHGEAASAVISAELVACTLGARVRPELQMDAHARLREAFARVGDQFKGAARQIQKAFANHPASKLLSN